MKEKLKQDQADRKICFYNKDLSDNDYFVNGHYYVTNDLSLLHTSVDGNFSIFLAGNWRYTLLADIKTKRCLSFSAYLDGLKFKYCHLQLPPNKKGMLMFSYNHAVPAGECDYLLLKDQCVLDFDNQLLCIGDNLAVGQAVEFAEDSYAVIDNGVFVSLYLILPSEINSKILNMSDINTNWEVV